MKYMVLVPNAQPEYVEADSFSVDDGHTLHLFTNGRESASFVGWLGIKETGPSSPSSPSPAAVQVTGTTTNPTRAKIKAYMQTARGREPLILGR